VVVLVTNVDLTGAVRGMSGGAAPAEQSPGQAGRAAPIVADRHPPDTTDRGDAGMHQATCHNGPMSGPRRWFDQSQPQTLQGAVMLSYITAALGLVAIILGSYPIFEIVPLGLGLAGYGVANEKRWGYWLGIVLAGFTVLLDVSILVLGVIGIIINLLFSVVLVALFLHPQSRQYQRIWFR